MDMVDVGVLVGDAVAGVVEDELDVGVELLLALDTVGDLGHLGAMVDGVDHGEHRDLGLHGVVASRHALKAEATAALTQASARAGKADVAREQRQHADGHAVHLAVGTTLRTPALEHEHVLGSRDFLGEAADAIGRDAAQGSSPLGGLLHHVVAGAHDIVGVGLVLALGALRHRGLVEADAVGVEELVVHLVVHDELVGDGRAQSGVGTRVDGQPLLRVAHGGVIQTGVDDVDLALGVLAAADPVVVGNGAALAGLRRAGAEAQHQVGVGHGREARTRHAGKHIRNDPLLLGQRVAAIVAQAAAEQVHETAQRTRRGAAYARCVVDVDSLVAVGVDGVLQLLGDGLKGLVPADLLVLAVATLRALNALHRVVDAVGVVHPAAVAAAAQAGAGLRVVEVVGGVAVGVDPQDLAVLHMELKRAAAGAVDGAVAPNLGDALLIGRGSVVSLGERGGACGTCGRKAGKHAARGDEGSP